jgi:hypothetical protein
MVERRSHRQQNGIDRRDWVNLADALVVNTAIDCNFCLDANRKVHVSGQTLELLGGEYEHAAGTEAAKVDEFLARNKIKTYLITPPAVNGIKDVNHRDFLSLFVHGFLSAEANGKALESGRRRNRKANTESDGKRRNKKSAVSSRLVFIQDRTRRAITAAQQHPESEELHDELDGTVS